MNFRLIFQIERVSAKGVLFSPVEECRRVLTTHGSVKSPTELLANQKTGYRFEKSYICLYLYALYKINIHKNIT